MNYFIIWKELSIFVGINQRAISEHQHPIIQLIVGIDGPYLWKDTEGKWIERKALLVSPNHSHECDANGRKVAIVSIDTDSLLGEYIINQYFDSQPLIDFSSNSHSFSFSELMKLIENSSWAKIHEKIEMLFNFDNNSPISVKKDERIIKVLEHINLKINSELNTKVLMEVSCLSESRLLHLFKQQMGLPIRNYILWCRIQIAFGKIVQGSSLTRAAYHAGFSDQAHLTRTFVKTIGIPPSSILKNSKFIQVFFPI